MSTFPVTHDFKNRVAFQSESQASTPVDWAAGRSDPDSDIQGWGENDRGVSFTFGADLLPQLDQFIDSLLRIDMILYFGKSPLQFCLGVCGKSYIFSPRASELGFVLR